MLIVVLVLLHVLATALGRSTQLRRASVALVPCLGLRGQARGYRRIAPLPCAFSRSPAKPAWVRQEIIRLKVLMSAAGTCRAIAQVFNRRFALKREMTVGRTFVNEAVFTSRVFRLALFLLGIRHQRIDPHCPWQNGRVERFFGTLKANLDQLTVDSLWALNAALAEFRFFHNHVRAHQNLDGRTPAEAWAAVDPFTARIRQEYWFEAWDGLLRGYYLRR